MNITALIIQPVLAFVLAPLLLGIINRTKAIFAGRRGQPLLQVYYDLWKLLHKGVVYSRSTSWIFRAAPIIGLAAVSVATLIVPLGHLSAPLAFEGDLILLAYIFALMRFFIVIGALDTASSFEGMGASREVTFSALAEPALLLSLMAVARQSGSISLSDMFAGISAQTWNQHSAPLLFAGAAMVIVLLAENARIPVDDPNTHLELTMIHEVMVLDNSGPDFAFILYAAALKLWVLSSLLVGVLLPMQNPNVGFAVAALFAIAIAIGIIESCMARLRLVRVPLLLMAATAFSVLALIFVLR
jgi:formate hydrogenlyase subunit 4